MARFACGSMVLFWVSNRVTRVNYRSYAVTDLEGNVASGRAEQTMLPQANPAFIGSNVRFGSQPRTSCQLIWCQSSAQQRG